MGPYPVYANSSGLTASGGVSVTSPLGLSPGQATIFMNGSFANLSTFHMNQTLQSAQVDQIITAINAIITSDGILTEDPTSGGSDSGSTGSGGGSNSGPSIDEEVIEEVIEEEGCDPTTDYDCLEGALYNCANEDDNATGVILVPGSELPPCRPDPTVTPILWEGDFESDREPDQVHQQEDNEQQEDQEEEEQNEDNDPEPEEEEEQQEQSGPTEEEGL